MSAGGRLIEYFERDGYEVREVTSLDEVQGLIESAEKPYLSSFGDPSFNDFTNANCLWLVVLKAGRPAYMGCARLEELWGEPIEAYWSRQFRRHHGEAAKFTGVAEEVSRELNGRLAYFGDLFVSKDHRGSRERLRVFLALAHMSVSFKWNPDWSYCFIREQHMLRGTAAIYGFTRQHPQPVNWVGSPPFPRTEKDWLVALPRRDLMSSVSATLASISRSIRENGEEQ